MLPPIVVLVRRGPRQFFIVCTRSPRFQWSRTLSHRDAGRNLDYFAPGHITSPPHPPRATILFIEKSSLRVLTAEFIIISVLAEPDVAENMQRFNASKESLYNDTMQKLGLLYRFKWILNTTTAREAVASIMMNPTPPTAAWWEDNCYFVNGFGFPEIVQEPWPFCSFSSKYLLWWPLIQTTYNFMIKYKHVKFWFSSSTTAFPYWNAMNNLFERIRSTTELTSSHDQLIAIQDAFALELKELEERAENSMYPSTIPDTGTYQYPKGWRPSTPKRLWTLTRCGSSAWFSCWERIKIRIWNRHKLREPLVRKGIWAPSSADALLFA